MRSTLAGALPVGRLHTLPTNWKACDRSVAALASAAAPDKFKDNIPVITAGRSGSQRMESGHAGSTRSRMWQESWRL
jgi:hypothetical protein